MKFITLALIGTAVNAQKTRSNPVADWMLKLSKTKMKAVFYNLEWNSANSNDWTRWARLGQKFIDRYLELYQSGCDFADTYQDDSIDLNSVDTPCRDINAAEAAFATWGQQFTYDCRKTKRNTHKKWFDRNIKHVQRIANKTRGRVLEQYDLDC